jgi:hypothetical protein
MPNMRRGVVEVIAMLLVGAVAGCGGGDSSSSTAAIPTAPTPTDSVPSVTFSGTVTNIVTGVRVGGATVTTGSVSATSSADGSYSLAATAAGQPAFSVAAPGYCTRNSQVSMVGSTTINPEIIPQGDGFDLTFFDWLFRDNGTKGTRRRIAGGALQYEIWTRQFTCLELSTDGYGACIRMQALEAAVPPEFETYARHSIAQLARLTGGALTNIRITTKSHTLGTIVQRNDWDNTGSGIVSMQYQASSSPFDADTAYFGQDGPDLSETLPAHIIYGSRVGLQQDIHEHEVAHSIGFEHPDGTPSLPTFMHTYPYAISSADELHGRILYKRPNGSLTPDRDPSGVTIN